MSIDCHVDAAVSHLFFHVGQALALLKQQAGEGMAQVMKANRSRLLGLSVVAQTSLRRLDGSNLRSYGSLNSGSAFGIDGRVYSFLTDSLAGWLADLGL